MAPIKSSLARSVSKLLGVFKDTDLSLRGATQSTRFFVPPISASGGTKVIFGGVIYHTFTSSGAFTIDDDAGKSSIDIDILVQGAGGGGGVIGGGGGAGGQVQGSGVSFPLTAGPYPVTIGTGGNVAPGQAQSGTDGGDTTLNTPSSTLITAKGGGGGGSHSSGGTSISGRPGGCGGGGGDNSGSYPYGTSTQGPQTSPLSPLTNFGSRGGTGSPVYTAGPRGGGGGGGTGGSGGDFPGRAGGTGKPYTIPTNGDPSTQTEYWFGGGGGGSPYQNNKLGPGGRGGGGGGWNDGPNALAPGGADGYGGDVNGNPGPEHNRGGRAATNSGGGGGGADWDDSPGFGSNYRTGGPGILVISYPITA